ncbi:hypothetical protein H8K32_19775 [Undibacterium jejuense]|uniref:Uncharacterized protein n=1 Tax=Undibacterium jejuense TaxID=1344949 RepID=A0A923HJR8_9BURK|nr:hypothetical protein [Undibacterium jejuense]MBC3864340.1 hypothetical protein [Undibacterium jejuense]
MNKTPIYDYLMRIVFVVFLITLTTQSILESHWHGFLIAYKLCTVGAVIYSVCENVFEKNDTKGHFLANLIPLLVVILSTYYSSLIV